jgi:hypothetical protein
MMFPIVFLVLVGTSWHLVNTIQCLQKNSNVTNLFPTHFWTSSWCPLSFTPMLFQRQIINVLFTSRWPSTGFHAQTTRALKKTNMKTCHVSMTARCSFQPIENCKPWASKQEPWNYHPPKHVKFRWHNPMCILMHEQPKPLKHIPTNTCNILRAMFWPHPPIFHVPPCNPHPCPMTHPWHFRPFSTFPHFV